MTCYVMGDGWASFGSPLQNLHGVVRRRSEKRLALLSTAASHSQWQTNAGPYGITWVDRHAIGRIGTKPKCAIRRCH